MLGLRIATVAVSAVALTSCSDGSTAPRSLPTLSPLPSGTPTTAPTPTASTSGLTSASASEFARHWYAEITRAWAERDASILKPLSAPGCTACERYISSITEVKANNERVEGVVFTIRLAEAQKVVNGRTRVAILYDTPVAHKYSASGRVLSTEPAHKAFQEELKLLVSGSSWLVEEDSAV